jgi:hypothetical protein
MVLRSLEAEQRLDLALQRTDLGKQARQLRDPYRKCVQNLEKNRWNGARKHGKSGFRPIASWKNEMKGYPVPTHSVGIFGSHQRNSATSNTGRQSANALGPISSSTVHPKCQFSPNDSISCHLPSAENLRNQSKSLYVSPSVLDVRPSPLIK